MTLTITRTTRWTAIATLLFLGVELSLPAAWGQAPSMPASGTSVGYLDRTSRFGTSSVSNFFLFRQP